MGVRTTRREMKIRLFMGIVLALHNARFHLSVNSLAVLSANSAESPTPAALIVLSASLIFAFIAKKRHFALCPL
jgi:hypothetical protein